MSFSKYTSLELAKLRAVACGNVIEGALVDLSSFVASAKQSFEDRNQESFVGICFDLWIHLSKVTGNLRLPPMHTGNDVKELVTTIFKTIFALQTVPTLSPGGNFMLNGIKGVGKTTILHVAGAITACLTDIIPVYWIYEQDSTRTGLATVSTYRLGHAAAQYFDQQGGTTSTFADFLKTNTESAELSSAAIKGEKFVFLLDEFTDLYERGDDGIDVVGEYRTMARAGNVFFLLAASKINVQKYIFPNHKRTPKMFPDLNCGLFEVKEVHPIRCIADFIDYWQSCFGEVIDEQKARMHFYYTGGVGRYILLYKERETTPCPVDMEIFHTDPELFHVACHLLNGPIANATISTYASPDKIDEWIDRLILYRDNHQVTFLLDSVKDLFREHLGTEKLLEQAHIFHIQRKGFDGGSSGHSNEQFICRHLPKYFDLHPHDKSLSLVVTNGVFTMTSFSNDQIELPLTDADRQVVGTFLEKYAKCFITWRVNGAETGLDRVWYDWDNDRFEMTLHAVQIKTGKDDQTITCGVLATERARATASACNDCTIAGIYSKAERGLMTLTPELRTRFGCTVAFGSVHLCTNKKAAKGFDEFFKKEMKSVERKFTLSSAMAKKLQVDSNFTCEFRDGTEWLDEITPEALKPFI